MRTRLDAGLRRFAVGLAALVALPTLSRPVAHAQGEPRLVPEVGRPVNFAVSPLVKDLPTLPPRGEGFVDERTVRNPDLPLTEIPDLMTVVQDAALQSTVGTLSISGPLNTFEGLSNRDNGLVLGGMVSPPDTNGDVGPNHYVQTTNLLVRVWDKAGVPLTPPFPMSSLFASLGGICATNDNGDPIVLYDPLADRWLISQFAFVNSNTPPFHQCIAISKTGDPTGQYFLYDFVTPGNKFNDYPHFGVWTDAYYMTDNQFNPGFAGGGVFAFERAKMLLGDPTASFIYFDLATNRGGMLPADLDGLNAPPAGQGGYFAQFLTPFAGDPAPGVRIFQFQADFATPANSTFTAVTDVPVAAFDPRSPAGRADIEQPPIPLPAPPGTCATPPGCYSLDSISDRLMHRLQYRNFGTHESLVGTHTVNVGTLTPVNRANHQAGIRYYELRRPLPEGTFTAAEQATFAPDTDNRWMGSAAMDGSGNLAVGYSVSSSTTFPSIRYAARLASDPPNGLFQGEATLQAGTGVQRSGGDRWGDYSALSVDPADDCTFWYTTEYYTAESQAFSAVGWLTRVGTFRLSPCTTPAQGVLQGTVTNASTHLPLAGVTVLLSNGASRVSDAAGRYSFVLAAGSYDMTASLANYQTATASGVVVADGGTTTQDFTLAPRGADITITKTGPAAVPAGAPVSFAIVAGNNGPLAATSVVVTDEVPAGTVFLSVTASQGSCTTPAVGAAGTVSCSLGTLAVGASATVNLNLHVTAAAGSVVNTATVSAAEPDDIAGNNAATARVAISCLPTLIHGGPLGSDSPDFPSTHGQQTGRLNRFAPGSVCGSLKTNPGLLPGDTQLRGFDAYRFTNVSPVASCATVNVDAMSCVGGTFIWAAAYLGDFDPADPRTNYLADVGGSPNPTGTMGFELAAGATATIVVHEVTPGAGCAAYTLDVQGLPCALADLSVTKTGTPNPVLTGSDITYSVNVANAGFNAAVNAVLTDLVPPNTTFQSLLAPAGWSCTTPAVGGTGPISCTVPTLEAGSSATFTPVVRVDCPVPDGRVISNTATVSSATGEPGPFDNAATALSTASNPVPVLSTVTASPSVLWPPNHKMVTVTVSYSVSDNCGPVRNVLTVTSTEPVNAQGDGNTSPDWIVLDDHHVQLRAERAGNGDGRVYTILVTSTDAAGGSTQRRVDVRVPKSQGR